MKHTHQAHCQACGRIQALQQKNNTIAKHGYKVSGWNYFMGTCPGSDHQPMQFQRVITDEIIRDCNTTADYQWELYYQYKNGLLLPTEARSGKRIIVNKRLEVEMIPYADATAMNKQQAVQEAIYTHETQARYARDHALYLTKLVSQVYDTPTIPVEHKPYIPVIVGTEFPNQYLDGQKFVVMKLLTRGFNARNYNWASCVAVLDKDNANAPRYQYSLLNIRKWIAGKAE